MVGAAYVTSATAEPFTGPYVGVQGGYGVTELKVSDTFGSGSIDSLSGSGLNGGLFAGYGHTSDRIHFGGEIEAGFSGAEHTQNVGTSSTKIEQDWTYGISGRLGYHLTDSTIAYGRLGWVWTRFKLSASDAGTEIFSSRDRFNGPRVGVGMETRVAANMSLRTDYTYTDYRSRTIEGTKFEPREHLFRVGRPLVLVLGLPKPLCPEPPRSGRLLFG